MPDKQYSVRAARCDHRTATNEQVYETLRHITDPLTRSWEKLEKAKKIVLKFNMMHPNVEHFRGRRRELVDDSVCMAVLRLLRERTSAHLIAADTRGYVTQGEPEAELNYLRYLREFDVEYVECNLPPFSTYEVPGGGTMFDRYTLNSCFGEADAVVSVAKMKNHGFMGVTMCMKNLFGITPIPRPHGRIRTYFHHAIRLSHVLPDLALITQPCLNIVDAMVGQYGREWEGEGRVADTLIAGDQTTATDACGAHLMGHDPKSDWPTPPFRRDRNHLLIAANRGFGTVDLDEIDFVSETDAAPLADFNSYETDTPEIAHSIRRSACEQGLIYRDKQDEMIDRYANDFIYMQDGDIVWHGEDPSHIRSHREIGTDKPGSALFMKLVDPQETEGERFEVYEENLKRLSA